MIPLQFSFESDRYWFTLYRYHRSLSHFTFEVARLASSSTQYKHQYLVLGSPLYFSGCIAWHGTQPYIAPTETLIQFAHDHPSVTKDILEALDWVSMLPEEDLHRSLPRLYIFPTDNEPVYAVADFHDILDTI